MSKKLEVPEEMRDLMDEWLVCIKCRDQAIESIFKAKRAIYYGKQAMKANRKFWEMAGDLYPEVSGAKWSYNFDDQMLHEPTS
jgi:hypothetical protein